MNKKGLRAQKKRSASQEASVAKRYSGRLTPASGALDTKGDVRVVGDSRWECKYTTSKSYSLKLEDLLALEDAASAGEVPLFQLEFQVGHPHKSYVVLREEDYAALRREVEGDQDD